MNVKNIGEFRVYYRPQTADEEVIKQSFGRDEFYRSIYELRLTESSTILDIGSHIGTFAMLSSKKVPEGMVFAIEAGLDSFNVLKKNIENNEIKNVRAFQLALSAKDGFETLYHSEKVGNWGFSITRNLGGEGEKVRSISFDSFLLENSLINIDFLKSNCEGAEFNIFINASDESIRKIKLGLILYHCDLQDEFSLDQLVDKFRNNGFSIEIFNRTKRRGWLLVKNKKHYNYSFLGSFLRSKYIFKLREKFSI
jgi:FkbM family methyltransferase